MRLTRLRTLIGILGTLCLSQYAIPNELLPGGEASTSVTGHNAYSQPSSNMSMVKRLDFSVGNSFFRNPWVIAPATTDARDGLGPLFNANACQACHIKDGRGHAPESSDDSAISMLVRISIPAHSDEDIEKTKLFGPLPDPVYGGQIQDLSIPNIPSEAKVIIHWQVQHFGFPDGEQVSLRYPELTLGKPAYGDMNDKLLSSIRVAPPMIGLGLLEAIPQESILSLEDPSDSNQDGISGRANQVWDVASRSTTLGRFGWKAGQPTLKQQNAAAFNGDLGITSKLFPKDDCQAAQTQCRNAPQGGSPEVSNKILNFVEFYSRNLAVPARADDALEKHKEGKALFEKAQCHLCHRPSYVTAKIDAHPEQSSQVIWPYTDLLLHDMGPGLADDRPEFLASGREWRTPPLWGLSQLKAVNGHTQLLHDGRARNVKEAILWHDGEAKKSREIYTKLNQREREALEDFVMSL